MEFILNTDLEKLLPSVIDFNFDNLKTELSASLVKYNNLVVTEDSIKSAKSDKASLNKLRTAVEDKRKEVKKLCLKPYEDFEAKVKELVALIDKPILAIDSQVKAFDEKEKEEKLAEIIKIYSENIGTLLEVLPFEKINNPKWLNKTVKIQDIAQEILDVIIRVKNDLRVIEAMKLACETQVKDTYLRNLNMSEALAEKARFEEQEKRLAELKEKEQEQKPVLVQKSFTPPQEKSPQPPVVKSDIRNVTATFFDTTPEFRADMIELCRKHNIQVK